ncbi:hypothetical protein HG530_002356 [Fusarium avenaceum]|nr:hypothetical protein HG530_002356 [Fusarium avenaceum]
MIHYKCAHRLVNFKDISSLLLELLNLLAGINLLASGLGLVGDSLLENLGHVRHRPCRTAQVEATLILNVGLGNILESLAHTVLDVDLLRLVTREGRTDKSNDASGQVRLPFLTIEVLLTLVTGSKVQENGTDLLALGLLHSTVLDKCTERSETRSKTGHDESLRRGNRVLSALGGADNLDKLMEARTSRLELLKDVDVGSSVDLSAALQVLSTSGAGESLELLLLGLISGKLSKSLVEALGRLAKDVDILNESLEDGTGLEQSRVLTSRNLDQLSRVKAVELDELVDLIHVVLGVDAQSLTNLVGKTGVTKIELNVEDVTVIVLRGKATNVLSTISLLECKRLGGSLPIAELESLLAFLLVVDDKAVAVDGGRKVGVSKVSINLSPGGGNLELTKAKADSIDRLLQSRVKDEELSGLLLESLSESNRETLFNLIILEVGKLDDDLATISQTLENIDFLENFLIANNNGVAADDATLREVVKDLVDIDVGGRLLGKNVANHTRRVEGRGAIEVPEGELLGLDERRQLLGLTLVTKDLVQSVDQTLRSESLGRGVLDVKNLGLAVKLARESNSGQDIAVESGLGGLVLDSELVLDLSEHSNSTELIVEKLEKLNNLSSSIKTSVELTSLSGELGVQVGNTVLTQGIDDTESLASNADTIIDVKSREEGSQESGEDGHVLGLIGRGAGNKTKAEVFGKAKSSVVVGNQALAVGVVESGDMGNERAGDTVEERELVESSAQLLETARRCDQRLRDVALGDIKVGRKDVTKSESTGADSGLEGKNLCGISVDVLLVLGGPFLECDIEVEGLGRV